MTIPREKKSVHDDRRRAFPSLLFILLFLFFSSHYLIILFVELFLYDRESIAFLLWGFLFFCFFHGDSWTITLLKAIILFTYFFSFDPFLNSDNMPIKCIDLRHQINNF